MLIRLNTVFTHAYNSVKTVILYINGAAMREDRSSGFPTRSDTNQAVQVQKMEIQELQSRGTVLFM